MFKKTDSLGRRMRLNPKPRKGEHKPQITKRDLVVFYVLQHFRYLRSDMHFELVCEIMGKRFSRNRFVGRLTKLTAFGYIERPPAQWQYGNSLYSTCTHANKLKAVRTLKDYAVKHPDKSEWTENELSNVRSLLSSRKIFAHDLMACHVMASIYLGTLRSGGKVRFVFPEELIHDAPLETQNLKNPFLMETVVSIKGETRNYKKAPDAVFALEYKDVGRRYFALEADRSTEPDMRTTVHQSSHLKHFLAYRYIIRPSRTKEPLYKRQLNFSNLLILNVTVSKGHMKGMQNAVMKTTDDRGSAMMLYQHTTTLGDFNPPPKPDDTHFTEPYERAGYPPFNISDPGAQ